MACLRQDRHEDVLLLSQSGCGNSLHIYIGAIQSRTLHRNKEQHILINPALEHVTTSRAAAISLRSSSPRFSIISRVSCSKPNIFLPSSFSVSVPNVLKQVLQRKWILLLGPFCGRMLHSVERILCVALW